MPAPRTIASVRAMGTCLRETKRDVDNIYGSGRAKSVSQAGGMADIPQDYSLAHVLGGEPVTAPDQVRGRLSPGHAREIGIRWHISTCRRRRSPGWGARARA